MYIIYPQDPLPLSCLHLNQLPSFQTSFMYNPIAEWGYWSSQGLGFSIKLTLVMFFTPITVQGNHYMHLFVLAA